MRKLFLAFEYAQQFLAIAFVAIVVPVILYAAYQAWFGGTVDMSAFYSEMFDGISAWFK